jgi:hypothetical protein
MGSSGETAVWVANESLQLHGGYGYIGEYKIERFYRDAKITEIYEGTKEIEKLVIARALLGKYCRLLKTPFTRKLPSFFVIGVHLRERSKPYSARIRLPAEAQRRQNISRLWREAFDSLPKMTSSTNCQFGVMSSE